MARNRIMPTLIKILPLCTNSANQSNGLLFAATILLQLVVFFLLVMSGCDSSQEKIVLPNNSLFIQKPKPTKLVVFIHGINGDHLETWDNKDQNFFWPRALAKDPNFTNADVLSFGYESECGPSLNIREIAIHLHTTLEAAMAKIPYQSLSFVAHSMGGLVVREFILTHLHKLHVPLDSIVLLSTPNLGSSLANVVKAFCNSDSLMDLQDGRSGYVDSLNDRWREQFEQPDSIKPFHFAAGYELVPMSWFTGKIVEKESAIAFANQISAFKKDHSTIAKLNGPTDPAYIWVKGRLLKAAPSPPERPMSEAEEQRYTEIIAKLQEQLRGTDLERALKLIAEERLDEALALLSEKENAEDKAIEKIARARFAKAQVLELQLRYRDALEYYAKAVQLAPADTTYLNELGQMHATLGDYDQAIAYYEKALASDMKTVGPEHPHVARDWNNLGEAWREKGDYDQAIAYYEKALASDMKTVGTEHPHVARDWNNLGEAWHAKGDYDQAITYYEKALASDMKTVGPEHPHVARDWNNLGVSWGAKGDYDQAITYYEKALASDVKTLRPEHPHVARDWNNLGTAWDAKGNYDQAITYYEKALASDVKTLGPEHPHVAIRWNNLGTAWHAKGDYDQAIAYYEKALASHVKTLGPEHPQVAGGWNNLGAAEQDKGNYDQAIAYYEKALASDAKTLGLEHPHVARDWNNLGTAEYAKGNYDQAIAYLEKALASKVKTLGPENPQVAGGWANLGVARDAKGDYDQAIAYYEKARKIYKQLGLDHRVQVVEKKLASAKKNFESQ